MRLRRFQAFFLLVTLSVSSVAMPVFTHVCHGMGKTWFSLFVPPNDCCDKDGSSAKACKPDLNATKECTLSKLPCCENEVSLAALGSNYTFQTHKSLSPISTAVIPALHLHIAFIGYPGYTAYQAINFDQLPTPRYGRSLLIFEQLFLC